MDSLTVSRCVFLLFIVVLSVYFTFLNKRFSGETEHFEAASAKSSIRSDDVDSIVKSTYMKEFKREPTEKELVFFQAYVIERQPNPDQLRAAVKESGEIIARAYEADAHRRVVELTSSFGTEDEVSEVYSDILNRPPDPDELYNFAKMLKEDKDFNLEKLKQILYGSEEYYRLSKTQTNQVYSNLLGGVTDRQITLIIMTHYKQIVKKEEIDADELRFLKKKLVDFNMDEALFRKFLESYVKNQPFNQQLAASQKAREMESKKKDEKAHDDAHAKLKKELFEELKKDLSKSMLAGSGGDSLADPATKVEHAKVEPANKKVVDVLLKTCQTEERSDNYLDSSDVIDSIRKQASCVFTKNAAEQKYLEDQQKSMAALINARNNQALRDTCVRNKLYLGLDEDMVLDPSLRWSVPVRHPPLCVGGKNDYKPTMEQTSLIGTLLDDASKTKVGDVLDFHPPK